MWKEFKQFAMRGNVVDMAVGIVIGTAFGKITSSMVADILMPPVGFVLGKVHVASLFITLSGGHYASLDEARVAGAVTINYGLFAQTVLDFLIIALVVFLLVRQINRLLETKGPAVPTSPTTKECPYCLSSIAIKATRCAHCTADVGAA